MKQRDFRVWHIASFLGAAEFGRYGSIADIDYGPDLRATATTDFLAADILEGSRSRGPRTKSRPPQDPATD